MDHRTEFRPTSGPAPFDLQEVFFSRTDMRGVIQSGNHVFNRVAGYSWDEMVGAPHKIIRHPDMPRAVFWLFWAELQAGRPVGAYVKNLAKDGLHYWVYAVAIPDGNGYLSARIKPTSPLLEMIESEYADLREREIAEDHAPEYSAELLLERFKALGYPTYDTFATYALTAELRHRDIGLNRAPDTRTEALCEALDHSKALKSETEGLIEDFVSMRTIPHNLRVIASRLEPTGGPISTLSKNYGIMSADMFDWFERHVVGQESNFATIKDSVSKTLFIHCMSRILRACDEQLSSERLLSKNVDIEVERDILLKLVSEYADNAHQAIDVAQDEAARILDACDKMERHMLGLSTTRVMCKIEGARLPSAGESLADIISQLKIFQDRIGSRLGQFVHLGSEIRDSLS